MRAEKACGLARRIARSFRHGRPRDIEGRLFVFLKDTMLQSTARDIARSRLAEVRGIKPERVSDKDIQAFLTDNYRSVVEQADKVFKDTARRIAGENPILVFLEYFGVLSVLFLPPFYALCKVIGHALGNEGIDSDLLEEVVFGMSTLGIALLAAVLIYVWSGHRKK